MDSACTSARCGGLVCGDGQVCMEDICEPDPCAETECGEGEACILGVCEPDPCSGVDCPNLERCEVVQGTAQCIGDWVGEVMDLPPEPRSEFDFREPPMSPEPEEEPMAGAMSEEEDTTEEPSAGEVTEDVEDSESKARGCDQSSAGATSPTAHLIGLMLLGLMGLTRRGRSSRDTTAA